MKLFSYTVKYHHVFYEGNVAELTTYPYHIQSNEHQFNAIIIFIQI